MNINTINPQRVLIINTFGIGDVLFTTPVITNLKAAFPDVKISYLGNRRTQLLLEEYEHIEKVFVYERDEFDDLWHKSKRHYLHKMKQFYMDLKKARFDVVFDFSLNSSANILTWFLKIPHRIGFNYKNRSSLLTVKVPFDGFESKHVVEHYLDLLALIGLDVRYRNLDLTITPQNRDWAADFLKNSGISNQERLIGVIPGAGASWGEGAKFRRWSSSNYAKLIDKMIEKYNAKIILMGGQSERDLCQKVQDEVHSDVISACGQTNLGQLAALIDNCKVVILNDGGPLHIAVAVKAKTVSIFGPVDEHVYGPFGSPGLHHTVHHDIACRPCYRRFRMSQCQHVSCLKNITVDDVFRKVESII